MILDKIYVFRFSVDIIVVICVMLWLVDNISTILDTRCGIMVG